MNADDLAQAIRAYIGRPRTPGSPDTKRWYIDIDSSTSDEEIAALAKGILREEVDSSDTPDTGAGAPLTEEPENGHSGDYNLGWSDGQASALDACNPIIEALQVQLASRPATDPAGLDVERLMTAYNNILVRPGIGWPPKRSEWDAIAAEYARLPVADRPGPEERLREALTGWETAARRHHKATNAPGTFEDCDSQWCVEAKSGIAALSRPLPENREEPSR